MSGPGMASKQVEDYLTISYTKSHEISFQGSSRSLSAKERPPAREMRAVTVASLATTSRVAEAKSCENVPQMCHNDSWNVASNLSQAGPNLGQSTLRGLLQANQRSQLVPPQSNSSNGEKKYKHKRINASIRVRKHTFPAETDVYE